VDSAELIASELATNAVESTGITDPHPQYADLEGLPTIGVQLQVRADALRIAVWDSSDKPPVPEAAQNDAESGRGLLLVEALSTRWGVHGSQAGGKVVWADLRTPPDFMAVSLPKPFPEKERLFPRFGGRGGLAEEQDTGQDRHRTG
jgi:hypothetical protein